MCDVIGPAEDGAVGTGAAETDARSVDGDDACAEGFGERVVAGCFEPRAGESMEVEYGGAVRSAVFGPAELAARGEGEGGGGAGVEEVAAFGELRVLALFCSVIRVCFVGGYDVGVHGWASDVCIQDCMRKEKS